MKPRLFIGSSRESLQIAYGIQRNLWESAEITVWTQGVFQGSQSNLESLLNALAGFDFGVFVFSPDDLVIIREERNQAVRDNVLFELGLFVGRLGRNRCYILVPDNQKLHLPTDLIGMNPISYEATRSDDNYQAGTAPACHEISGIMKREGSLLSEPYKPEGQPKESTSTPPEISPTEALEAAKEDASKEIEDWLSAFISGDYEAATKLLQAKLEHEHEDKERLRLESWLGLIKMRVDAAEGLKYLSELPNRYPNDPSAFSMLASAYEGAGFVEEALGAAVRGLQAIPDSASLLIKKAELLSRSGKHDDAAATLLQEIEKHPETEGYYTTLSEVFVQVKKQQIAAAVLELGIANVPLSEVLLARYASILSSLGEWARVLLIYQKLLRLKPNNFTYQTLAGNAYLELGLNGLSLDAYITANRLAEEKQGWILGNIGNINNNQGFHSVAIDFFDRALAIEPESRYSQERRLAALRNLDQEKQKLGALLAQASQAPKLLDRLKFDGDLRKLVLDGLRPPEPPPSAEELPSKTVSV